MPVWGSYFLPNNKIINSYAPSHDFNFYLKYNEFINKFITKWMGTFATDERAVVLSLSNNKNIDDSMVDILIPVLPVICYLNLSATSLTDAGLTKLTDAISKNGIGRLKCIDVSEIKVSDAVVKKLKDTIKQAAAAWEKKNKGAKYRLEEGGVIYRKPMTIQEPGKKPAVTPVGAPAIVSADASEPIPATIVENPVPAVESVVTPDVTTEIVAPIAVEPDSTVTPAQEMAPTPSEAPESEGVPATVAPIPTADSTTEAVASDAAEPVVAATVPTEAPEANAAAPKKKVHHVAHAPKVAPATTDASVAVATTPIATTEPTAAPEASVATPKKKNHVGHGTHAPKAAPATATEPTAVATEPTTAVTEVSAVAPKGKGAHHAAHSSKAQAPVAAAAEPIPAQ